MSGPPARAGPLCCVYMEDFQPSKARSRVVNGEISPKRAAIHINAESFCKRDDQSSRISPKTASPSRRADSPPYKHPLRGLAFYRYKHRKFFIRGMTIVVGSRQRGQALLGGLTRLHINTP